MFKDGDFKRDRPILSAIQSLEEQMLANYRPVFEKPEAYVDADGIVRYRRAEPKSIRDLVQLHHASAKPGMFAPQGIMCKEFKPFFVPWWDCEAPATIKDSQIDIRIKRKKINFNFNN